MITIGITGGIGSGKSYFCKRLEAAGIPVFYADAESKKLVSSNEDVRNAIVALLGNEAYKNDGSLDRKFVADKIFSNTKLRNSLNGIIHPAVHEQFKKWTEKLDVSGEYPVAAMEAAILYESEFDKFVDKVVVITAPSKIRTERVMERDHCEEEDVKRRMKAQWPEKRKVELADFVINNSPADDLNQQLFELLKKLYALAEKRNNAENKE